ncbi:ATP-binding protein [Candidatus Babeliales bacterium]|nr:ATP-binding protein [Candidatus Babeliales bacterium]MBP9844245.1 ATP-binding protein [Candidatus Babeliales bacterium]
MFIHRIMAQHIAKFQKFPVVAILGPRQSGKTTFTKKYFTQHAFVSFEQESVRQEAQQDPEKFFKKYENQHGIIIDEFQYVPEILSYLKYLSDERGLPGYFVLTGSSNFLMNEQITQSLAGRVGILTMLPLSIGELELAGLLSNLDDIILQGGYPRVYQENFAPDEFYPSYIHSYIERDVRQLTNVVDLHQFQRFMKLCAARVGQLLNVTDLATNCGISLKTAERWLSILQASYVIFLLQPYHVNFNKRVIKQTKLYFYDTGIAASLLELKDTHSLSHSYMYGHLFENFIITDLMKQYHFRGTQPPLYFWRDKNGRIEVDCLINQGYQLIPIEIKSSMTMRNEYFDGLIQFQEMSQQTAVKNYVIYAGDTSEERNPGMMLSWKSFGSFVDKIL